MTIFGVSVEESCKHFKWYDSSLRPSFSDYFTFLHLQLICLISSILVCHEIVKFPKK